MSVAAFDTRAAVKDLRDAGVPEAHADAIVATMYRAMNETVATSADLQAIDARLDTELARVDTKLARVDTKLARVDTELRVISTRLDHMVTKGEFYRAIGAAVLAIVGLTTGLVFAVLRVVAP